MARLPVPGGDDGTWGDVLNQFLVTQHNTDGTHNLALSDLTDVSTAGASNGQVLTYNAGSWAPAAGGGGGDPAVGGDLTGTASTAQIAAGAIINADVNASAAIAQSKIANLTSDLAGKANTTHTHAIADTTNLQTSLDAKADETITVSGGTSLTGGGDLTTNRTLTLVNDAGAPGNSRYYGTDGAGTKGYHAIPTQDPAVGGDLTGTTSNAQIAPGAIVDADINASASIAQSKVANLTTDLSNKLNKKNDTVTLTDSTNDRFVRVDIDNDGSSQAGWPDRLAFYYLGTTRTGYHNEYGELRARPAKSTTVALRAMYFGSGSANIFEVAPSATGTEYFAVSSTAANLTVPLSSTSTVTATNLLYTTDKGAANGVASLDAGTKIPVAQLPTAPITKVLPYSHLGSLVVSVGTFRLYNDSGAAWTITGVRASVGTAPAGASILVDINKNGTTIFTTQGNRPAIAAAANTSGNVTNMDVTSVASGEYLTVDIDQVGSTTAGADLTVQVEVI